ncbi:hypothetical protein V8C44DRAFT_237005 [Trichoderma aethiopicum]
MSEKLSRQATLETVEAPRPTQPHLGRPGSGRVAVRVRRKSASTVLSGPRPKKSDGKDIVPDHPGIISTFFFGTMTHSQQPWQIPEFSSLGCWKHWHGYVPPLELNHTPAILFFLCFFSSLPRVSIVPIVPAASLTPYLSSSYPRIF